MPQRDVPRVTKVRICHPRGAVLISYIGYRTLLVIVVGIVGACATYLLAQPAPEPVADAPLLIPAPQQPGRRTADPNGRCPAELLCTPAMTAWAAACPIH
jgi:hypothetical protein